MPARSGDPDRREPPPVYLVERICCELDRGLVHLVPFAASGQEAACSLTRNERITYKTTRTKQKPRQSAPIYSALHPLSVSSRYDNQQPWICDFIETDLVSMLADSCGSGSKWHNPGPRMSSSLLLVRIR